jgi:hypothetical protein
MPISFTCNHCGRSLNVRDELASADIYCPDCRAVLTVPGGPEFDDENVDYRAGDLASRVPASASPSQSPQVDPTSVDTSVQHDNDTVDESSVSSAAGNQPRPLLILAGSGLLFLAVLSIVLMVANGKPAMGVMKLAIFLVLFGTGTLLRGLGITRR